MNIEILKTEIIDAQKIIQIGKNKFKIIYFGGYVGDEFGETEKVESNLWSIEEDVEELGGEILDWEEDDEIGYGECIIKF